ncbi:hypothetical protein ACJX0J_035375, partial [Zea mays]
MFSSQFIAFRVELPIANTHVHFNSQKQKQKKTWNPLTTDSIPHNILDDRVYRPGGLLKAIWNDKQQFASQKFRGDWVPYEESAQLALSGVETNCSGGDRRWKNNFF